MARLAKIAIVLIPLSSLLIACGSADRPPVLTRGVNAPAQNGGASSTAPDDGAGANGDGDGTKDTPEDDPRQSACSDLGACCAGFAPGDTSIEACDAIVLGNDTSLCWRRLNALRGNQQCL